MSGDTIYALASARGTSGVAVIRASGDQAFAGLKILSGNEKVTSRRASLRILSRNVSRETSDSMRLESQNVSRETLDHALILPFENPHSYTGEDVVEYHVHGGMAVIKDVLDALSHCPNHRMAEPGEFTRRAFENGKMDLTEAEGVADLIHAETQLQKAQALQQLGGGLADVYNAWCDKLTKILAYVEAELEFPDEDLPIDLIEHIRPQVTALSEEIAVHLNDNRRGERLRDGIHIAIIGAPNAGKSSLVNALTQRDVAIVSEIAGTTRDVIEAHLDIAGYPVILSDTAGLRPEQLSGQGQDSIESEGIKRAFKIAEQADIRVILYDGTSTELDTHSHALEKQENTLPVINKADENLKLQHPNKPIEISVKQNKGITEFLNVLEGMIESLVGVSEAPAITRERHRTALNDCQNALNRSMNAHLPELAAEDLRLAIRDVGRITGRVDVEDLLDVVFRDFCIGK